jgi:endogenous inhibitor of DNA gyrase (YacG/DUF329 family)
MTPVCPSCRRAVLLRDQNPCFPFCSDRCKAIDLGRWLGGEYRIPVVDSDDDDDGSAPPETPPTDA